MCALGIHVQSHMQLHMYMSCTLAWRPQVSQSIMYGKIPIFTNLYARSTVIDEQSVAPPSQFTYCKQG